MPDRRRANCMACGESAKIVGPISWRGNCQACGHERLEQSIDELVARKGPMYRRWQERILAGILATPLDTSGDDVHTGDHAN